MRRRALHWLLLCFTTLWFGVLVPVHNRGEISLPGGDAHCAASRDATSCSASPAPRCHAAAPSSESHHDQAPATAPKTSCAVCFFMAGLDAPPPVTWIETRLGLAGVLEVAVPQGPPAARAALPFHSRAPPAA